MEEPTGSLQGSILWGSLVNYCTSMENNRPSLLVPWGIPPYLGPIVGFSNASTMDWIGSKFFCPMIPPASRTSFRILPVVTYLRAPGIGPGHQQRALFRDHTAAFGSRLTRVKIGSLWKIHGDRTSAAALDLPFPTPVFTHRSWGKTVYWTTFTEHKMAAPHGKHSFRLKTSLKTHWVDLDGTFRKSESIHSTIKTSPFSESTSGIRWTVVRIGA